MVSHAPMFVKRWDAVTSVESDHSARFQITRCVVAEVTDGP